MTNSISIQGNIKVGMCPHGVPRLSCPICNGKNITGMSSGKTLRRSPKGWSYQRCYLVGLQIRAAKQRRDDAIAFFENRFQRGLNLNKNFHNISKLNNFLQYLKPIIQPGKIRVLISHLSVNAGNYNRILFKILSASEKIGSIIGELKNFIYRKIYNDLKKTAKKFMSLFLYVIEDENYKNDDNLAVFKSRELKRYIQKDYERRNKNTK